MVPAALEAEIAGGDISEAQAIEIATRALHDNAMQCFDVAGRQAALRANRPTPVAAG